MGALSAMGYGQFSQNLKRAVTVSRFSAFRIFANLDVRKTSKTRNCGSAFQILGKCPYPMASARP